MNFLVLPLFFLSGALFPLTNLPKIMTVITRLDPLSYGVDGLRGAFLGLSQFGALTDAVALAAVALVLLMLGSYSFSKIQI
jgi:ABC-2 type transport system permease protein